MEEKKETVEVVEPEIVSDEEMAKFNGFGDPHNGKVNMGFQSLFDSIKQAYRVKVIDAKDGQGVETSYVFRTPDEATSFAMDTMNKYPDRKREMVAQGSVVLRASTGEAVAVTTDDVLVSEDTLKYAESHGHSYLG